MIDFDKMSKHKGIITIWKAIVSPYESMMDFVSKVARRIRTFTMKKMLQKENNSQCAGKP